MGGQVSVHILVAEGNDFNAQLLAELLVRRGHRVELVRDGESALRRVAEQRFQLLLLDIHMPLLDGFHVIHALRETERTQGEIPEWIASRKSA